MFSPTAVLVTKVPMPARVLPAQSRANAGLKRSGVRSTKCERRVLAAVPTVPTAPAASPGWTGAGASGPEDASVTERNYATTRSPDAAGRHASASRSREPSRTHSQPPPAPRRATCVQTLPSARDDVVIARSPVTSARTETAETDVASSPHAPLAVRTPAASAAAKASRIAGWPAASRPRGRLTTASAAYSPTMASRSAAATAAAKAGSRSSGEVATKGLGCVVVMGRVVMGHTVSPATDSRGTHRHIPGRCRAREPPSTSLIASGLYPRSAVLNGDHVVSAGPRHFRVQRQHLQVPHGSRDP